MNKLLETEEVFFWQWSCGQVPRVWFFAIHPPLKTPEVSRWTFVVANHEPSGCGSGRAKHYRGDRDGTLGGHANADLMMARVGICVEAEERMRPWMTGWQRMTGAGHRAIITWKPGSM